MLKNTHKP